MDWKKPAFLGLAAAIMLAIATARTPSPPPPSRFVNLRDDHDQLIVVVEIRGKVIASATGIDQSGSPLWSFGDSGEGWVKTAPGEWHWDGQ